MATFPTGIKINAAVAVFSAGTPATIYTAPSNGYATLNWVQVESGGNPQNLLVGGLRVSKLSSGVDAGTVYVGPSQAVSWTGGAGGGTVYLTGVEFVNG